MSPRSFPISGAFAIFVVLGWLVWTTSAWSDELRQSDLRLLPEPRLSTFLFRGYEPDREGTNAYYDSLFEGKSAEEIVRFLEANGYYVHFPADNELFFTVTRRVVFFDYSARVGLIFENGLFKKANVTGWGLK